MTLLAVKGLKAAAFDTVELTLEGKTSAFDLSAADSKKAGEEGEVVRGVLGVLVGGGLRRVHGRVCSIFPILGAAGTVQGWYA